MNISINPHRIISAALVWAKPSHPIASQLSLLSLLLLTLFVLLIRIDHFSFVPESVWAESGSIFINQSHELGVRSLWEPYAGYLWLYARIVALAAKPLPLDLAPYVFFLSWLGAFLPIVTILNSKAAANGLNKFLVGFLICAIALQPNHGETFFTLSNTHNILGLALTLHVAIPAEKPPSKATGLFLIIASLTGPFSTFMIVVLALQWSVLRDFTLRKVTYTIVSLCGAIQAAFVLRSERVAQIPIDLNMAVWSREITQLLFFGGTNKLSNVAALVLWAVTSVLLARWILYMKGAIPLSIYLGPLFAVATAFVMLLIAPSACGPFVTQLGPLDMCSRFFLIPYSMFFFVALTCSTRHGRVQTVVICLISLICGAGFLAVDRAERGSSTGLLTHQNLQWPAFSRFREIKPDLAIPLNPPWPVYPPVFEVNYPNTDTANGAAPQPIALRPQGINPLLAAVEFEKIQGSTAAPRQSIYFDVHEHCITSRYLALEVEIWRSRMGHARLHWANARGFSAERSLERFYPGGTAVMQFAFRRDLSDVLLRLDPAEGIIDSAVVHWVSTWKDLLASEGFTVAEPTQRGGEVIFKEARLFCLR